MNVICTISQALQEALTHWVNDFKKAFCGKSEQDVPAPVLPVTTASERARRIKRLQYWAARRRLNHFLRFDTKANNYNNDHKFPPSPSFGATRTTIKDQPGDMPNLINEIK
jgi:hypothetical protein